MSPIANVVYFDHNPIKPFAPGQHQNIASNAAPLQRGRTSDLMPDTIAGEAGVNQSVRFVYRV